MKDRLIYCLNYSIVLIEIQLKTAPYILIWTLLFVC